MCPPIVFSIGSLVFAWVGRGLLQAMRTGAHRVTPALAPVPAGAPPAG
jgi:hypothetical protein